MLPRVQNDAASSRLPRSGASSSRNGCKRQLLLKTEVQTQPNFPRFQSGVSGGHCIRFSLRNAQAILLHAIYFRHLRFVRDDRLWEGALGVAGPPFRERDTNRSSRTTKSYVLDSRPMTADDGSLFRHPTDYSTYRERRILLPAEWNVTGATKDTGNFTRSDFSYKPSIGHTDTDLSFCYVPTTRSMEKSSGPVHQSQE